MTKFDFDAVYQHIRKKHPGCPEFAVEYLAKEISGREWTDIKLGGAVGITMDGLLRHEMTEYETLLLHGIDRKEARRRVQPKIDAMLRVWKRRPDEA
ncbi:DUF2293 domain-containing protein [Agrobacterium deltaense]|uniref:DUF2293 domain-containing protein n=1 Tax=Agrobacterium deltaense TaxID=1183412 RepID=UPI001C6E1857|nr:DUF2293 domain-containing protein [Agrobacterium deltaense]MBW9074535.1 DUF2293 domain-containing protein [Agrobacterium deltaense]